MYVQDSSESESDQPKIPDPTGSGFKTVSDMVSLILTYLLNSLNFFLLNKVR
jgi:hypothetical protein